MRAQVLRQRIRQELEHELTVLNEELFKMHMSRTTGLVENPVRARFIRRDIARIKTLLAEDTSGLRKLAAS